MSVPSPTHAPLGPGKWWKQGREEATTSGAAQRSVAAYWEAAASGPATSRPAHRSTPLTASHITLTTDDNIQGRLTINSSSYAQDFTSKHQKMGRRGVAQPPEAAQARAEAAAAAARNSAAGRAAHVSLNHFEDEDRASGLN